MTYIPHSEKDIQAMLEKLGKKSLSELFASVPEKFRFNNDDFKLPNALAPHVLEREIRNIASKNKLAKEGMHFVGAGLYNHYVPALVDELAGRQEFYTAYTPYQPEVSQGTLRAIFEYQTMISRLTGLPISNASLYDGATATAEAVLLALRVTKKQVVAVGQSIHPEYRKLIESYIEPLDVKIIDIPYSSDSGEMDRNFFKSSTWTPNEIAAVVVGSPNFFGVVEDIKEIKTAMQDSKAKLIVTIEEAVSMALLKSPGSLGADIVVGEAASLGNYMNFGGPLLGFISVHESLLRNLPGRVCGETKDKDGKRAFVFTLSTREQHIRRERATSNICSNQNLLAIRAVIYLSYFGEKGVNNIASICHERTSYGHKKLSQISGIKFPFKGPFFNEFVIKVSDAEKLLSELADNRIYAGVHLKRFFNNLENHILISFTELNSKEDVDELAALIKQNL